MSERTNHKFEFTAKVIAATAAREAEYHERRHRHWERRRGEALERVKETIGAEVVEHETTGGRQASVVVKYGDPAAWKDYQLAYGKADSHRAEADRYRTDERVYGTQNDRAYDLDTDDVHHFRLGGQERES